MTSGGADVRNGPTGLNRQAVAATGHRRLHRFGDAYPRATAQQNRDPVLVGELDAAAFHPDGVSLAQGGTDRQKASRIGAVGQYDGAPIDERHPGFDRDPP